MQSNNKDRTNTSQNEEDNMAGDRLAILLKELGVENIDELLRQDDNYFETFCKAVKINSKKAIKCMNMLDRHILMYRKVE